MNLRVYAALGTVQAGRALLRNKLRTALAAVAITIGIGAVVCVVAIGRAGSQRAEEQLQSLGDNFVWIEAGSRAPNGVRTGSHGSTSLTLEDAEAIARDLTVVKRVTPNVDGRAQVVFGDRNWNTHWRGINADYFDIRRWGVAEGSAFLEDDVLHARSIVLLGQTVKQKLFGSDNPLGKVVRLNQELFTVTGVLAAKGQNPMGQDQDDTVIVPYTAAQLKLRARNQRWLDDILCSAVAPQAVVPAIDQISALLRERHRLRPGQEDDFNVRRPDEIINAQIETSHALEVLLVSIAAIALVVGGIGIMNVMLVSVTERTREIGLRLAVGATEGAVQAQFLGEAVLLALLGGLLGIGLGAAGCAAVAGILRWHVTVPADALFVAPSCSFLVGLVFGFYPARRAAQLDPIEALRHE